MTERFVIDTGALTLFFIGDVRTKAFFDKISRGTAEGYISSVTLSEYYYKTCQKLGADVALLRYQQSRTILTPIETDADLGEAAGMEKCRRGALSLADCFALALTRRLGGLLLTTDSELKRSNDVEVRHFEIG